MNIELDEKQLCKMFDHTQLKAYASEADFISLCRQAKELNVAMVAINGAPVELCKALLQGTDIHVGAAISFPLGQATLETKLFEAADAINRGADEIDYVINIGQLKDGHWDYIRLEMMKMVELCHSRKKICKVIFENCYLEKEEIRKLAQIAREIKPDYIKTSTGFGISGARVEDVKLMKETVGDAVKVKAAGGIRDWPTCKAMIEAGAERIGTSSSLAILEGFRKEKNDENADL